MIISSAVLEALQRSRESSPKQPDLKRQSWRKEKIWISQPRVIAKPAGPLSRPIPRLINSVTYDFSN
jgi:hypothetical protein